MLSSDSSLNGVSFPDRVLIVGIHPYVVPIGCSAIIRNAINNTASATSIYINGELAGNIGVDNGSQFSKLLLPGGTTVATGSDALRLTLEEYKNG